MLRMLECSNARMLGMPSNARMPECSNARMSNVECSIAQVLKRQVLECQMLGMLECSNA
jgi:hypothetical protein